MNKIVHIGRADKFIPPFIEFVKKNFDLNMHEFWMFGGMAEKQLQNDRNVHLVKKGFISERVAYFKIIYAMHNAEKIILHGLFDSNLIRILFFMPWLLKKCYWVLWGHDLYTYKLGRHGWKWSLREFFRRPVIKNVGYITTTVPGDYGLAVEWYSTTAEYIQNLMYMSHVSRDVDAIKCAEEKGDVVYIQLGNSADATNNHIEIIDRLEKYKELNIKVYCPLSYGDKKHKTKVIEYGLKKLGAKFIPITNYMSFEEYNQYMSCIDVAIFNHDRQQAMGNIIGLLSLGKKVYLKSSETPFKYFENLDIKVFPTSVDINLKTLTDEERLQNIENTKAFFTEENLKNSWKEIFSV